MPSWFFPAAISIDRDDTTDSGATRSHPALECQPGPFEVTAGAIAGSASSLSEQRLNVARPVNHVRDIHSGSRGKIENEVLTFRPDSQCRMQIIASRPKFGELGETLKVIEKAVDQSFGGGFIVDGNVGVDLLQVSLGLRR